MRIKTALQLIFISLPFLANAQATREEIYDDINKAGGVYYAYPVDNRVDTPAPDGYEPFYVSHYGRHGSRYLISDNDYTGIRSLLADAAENNALTELGLETLEKIDSLLVETNGRGGDLSPLGVRQHKAIASRLARQYPEIFGKENVEISARSTLVVRCVLSMAAFCEALKEINPSLDITRESSNRYMDYLCYHSPESNEYTSKEWKEQYRKFEERHTKPDRIVASLFSDPLYVEKYVNPHELMWSLYWIAVDMQNVETDLDFMDLFTREELFDLWKCFNYRFYACDSAFEGNRMLPVKNARNLLRNIIESADDAIASGKPSATLRFGHDGNLIPLAAILELKDCANVEGDPEKIHEAFADFKIAPMAGNIQMIFLRNEKDPSDVIVKFMLNEREITIPLEAFSRPYYKWNRVRDFYMEKLSD